MVVSVILEVARARMTESMAGARFFWGDEAGVETVEFLDVVLREAEIDD